MYTDIAYVFAMYDRFHNYILYSGQLSKFFDVKIYQQGEGPVNTIGGFFGTRIPIKLPLETWLVLRGEKGDQYVHNWDDSHSPMVHQGDRFLGKDFSQGYMNLAVARKVMAE